MSKVCWQPSDTHPYQMRRYLNWLNQEHGHNFTDYDQLYQWSIDDIAAFWQSIWQYFAIKASTPFEQVYQASDEFWRARWFSGAKLNYAQHALTHNKDKTAIIVTTGKGVKQTLSYGQLNREVAKLAAAFKAEGIGQGDTIAAFLPNQAEAAIALLAANSLGAIFSSCSPDFGVTGVTDRFGQIKPKLLLATDGQIYNGKHYDCLDKVRQISHDLPSLQKVIVTATIYQQPDLTGIKNAVHYHDFLIEAETLSFAALDFDHPLYILYSSGTTGKPKCIVHGQGGTLLQHYKELALHTDISPDDKFFYYTTCGWMMWNWLISGLLVGATIVLHDGSPTYPHMDSLFHLIDELDITVFGTSAKYLASLEKAGCDIKQKYKLASLKAILSTGSPLAPQSFDYVYQQIKSDLRLCSISGGTDIVSCFALGNPLKPIYRGELQSRGLGMAVEVFDNNGQSVIDKKGELVCTKPFPCRPIYFWNDENYQRYQNAYFTKFNNTWAHGDYAKITTHGGLVIYGRSDATLNPGGVRIGTAEIYRQVEKLAEIQESLVTGLQHNSDQEIVLFVILKPGFTFNEDLIAKIKQHIRKQATPRHVPHYIFQVDDIPRTLSGKLVELTVQHILHHEPVENLEALANPQSLAQYEAIAEQLKAR